MQCYPFDIQTCLMTFNLVKQHANFAELAHEPDQLALHTDSHSFKNVVYFNWQRLFNDIFCHAPFADLTSLMCIHLSIFHAITK